MEKQTSFLSNIKDMAKRGFFSRLVDMEDTSVSATNVFLVIITVIGLILLLVPAMAVVVELIFSHTVTMNWSDMGSYIGAVACLFASGGITKAWSNWSNYKYNIKRKGHASLLDNSSDEEDESPIDDTQN